MRSWHNTRRTLDRASDDTATLSNAEFRTRVYAAASVRVPRHPGQLHRRGGPLHVHKTTVHYRVRTVEESSGRPLTERRLDIEVALPVCAQLGLPKP